MTKVNLLTAALLAKDEPKTDVALHTKARQERLDVLFDEAAELGRREMAANGPYRQIECSEEFEVHKIILDPERSDLPIPAIIAPTNAADKPRKVLLLARPSLPKIKKGTRLRLTEYAFGDCMVYQETLPRGK